jgi:hypothetical protein
LICIASEGCLLFLVIYWPGSVVAALFIGSCFSSASPGSKHINHSFGGINWHRQPPGTHRRPHRVRVVFVRVDIQVRLRGHKASGGNSIDRMRPAVKGEGRTGITHIYPYPGIPCVRDHGCCQQDKPTVVATRGQAGTRRHSGVTRQGGVLADRATFYERGRSRYA